jgi:undecaprenyl-phosphate galactose phosphotransferase
MGPWADTIWLVYPGITGLWQVSGRNEIDFAGRLELDARYVRQQSLGLDISILIRTIPVLINQKGAC